MASPRGAVTGLRVAGLAGLAWAVAAFAYEMAALATAGVVFIAFGFFLAAAGAAALSKPGLRVLAAGFALATAGSLAFLVSIGPGYDLGTTASTLFASGLTLATLHALAWAIVPASGRRRARGIQAGAVVGAAAGALWVVSDALVGGHLWQPGNVLVLVGLALVARNLRALPAAVGAERGPTGPRR